MAHQTKMTQEELKTYHVGDTILDENWCVVEVRETEAGVRYVEYVDEAN